MKIVAVAVVVAMSALADEKKLEPGLVPGPVLKALAARYPKVPVQQFSAEREHGKTVYEVVLKAEAGPIEVTVTPEGTIIQEEQVIAPAELPESVKKGLAGSKYAGARVLRVEKVTEAAAPAAPTFELLVEEGGVKHELVFSAAGVLSKVETKQRGDED